MSEKRYQRLRKLLDFYMYVGVALLIIALILITIPLLPYFYYFLNAEATTDEVSTLESGVVPTTTPSVTGSPTPTPTPVAELPLPAKDPKAPKSGWLRIPKIGVDTEIIEGKDAKRALYKGVWRDPQFPKPLAGKPVVLAAHRYGYIEWSSEFRRKSSFRNLPRLEKGDTIIVYEDQRPVEYEVYKKETKRNATDYEADLILYTCQYLKSPERIFIYAKRVK